VTIAAMQDNIIWLLNATC